MQKQRRSNWPFWISFRYLKSKKNSRFLSFITFVSIFGVGLGVASMIIVLSVMDGFESELKKRLMQGSVHVLIRPTIHVTQYNAGKVPENAVNISEIQSKVDFIQEIWPVLSTEVILKTGRKVKGVTLKGVTSNHLKTLKINQNKIKEIVIENGIWLGQELSYELGLQEGSSISLISPTEMEGPFQNIPRIKNYSIQEIYHSGLTDQELNTVYASEDLVQSFLKKKEKQVSQWEIVVSDFSLAPQVAKKVKGLISPLFEVKDWVQLNSSLFSSLRLERIAMFIILLFIVVVASFNIVTTLTLMILEKRKDLSILRAMGARNSDIQMIFLSEGLWIGGVGITGGVTFGFFVCFLLRRYQFIQLPDIYYDRTLPVTFLPEYYFLVSLCAALIVLGACLYPSQRAASLSPLDGIRQST